MAGLAKIDRGGALWQHGMASERAQTLSAYCERNADAFWAEPLNAVTNGWFIVAGVVAYVMWRRSGSRDWFVLALILNVLVIGVGSFLFHTRPSFITVLLDVVPIQIFVLAYLALAIRRFLGATLLAALGAIAGLTVFSLWIADQLGPMMRGGVGYLPAMAALIIVGFALILRARSIVTGLGRAGHRRPGEAEMEEGVRAAFAGRALLLGAILFAVSLTFRTIDQPLCTIWPYGTHFIWHTLNALLLFWLLLTAMRHSQSQGAR